MGFKCVVIRPFRRRQYTKYSEGGCVVSKMLNRLKCTPLFFKRVTFVVRIFIIVPVLIDVQNYFFCMIYVQVIRRT